jgi:uncharacterized protein YecE (DUF72 family)
MPGKIRVGTSGWMYKAWHSKFYPAELKKDFLPYYSRHFNTVEINNSFYHLPPPRNFIKWRNETTSNFVFAVKLSRAITHAKKLIEAEEFTRAFLVNYSALGAKKGPILVQLPPSFKFDAELVAQYFRQAKKIATELGIRVRFALEVRHPSWFLDQNQTMLFDALKSVRVAPVIADSGRFPGFDPDRNSAGNFVYVRLHGPEDFAASQYAKTRLKPWAERVKKWSRSGQDVFFYFNNDVHGYAIDDARILLSLIKNYA